MGTRYFRAGNQFQAIGTHRLISVNSSLATRIYMSTGYTAISMFNQGSTPLVWGDTRVTVNSGNYLFPLSRIEWTDVQDDFNFFVVSDSTGTFGLALITEYR